jgi:glutamyl-tRNA synthetase
LHLGGLFGVLTDQLMAQRSGGVYYIRMEDTDKKREVANGVRGLVDDLAAYGLLPQEGVTGAETEAGAYGPYTQSKRAEIYHAFAKRLVEEGKAYPCFCTAEELDAQRETQAAEGANKGYYGAWARCRDLPPAEQLRRLAAGEPHTLRLRSPGEEGRKFTVTDQIKGKLELTENTMDVVLLKANGIPTYHFAHAVDDHLMRTTHVVRGDEWIASLPLHVQLFAQLGFTLPKYCHTPTLMKEEDGSKRKISKRKDPEAAVRWFVEQGYPGESVLEYLLTLMNSNFEDWRRANPAAAQGEFPFSLKKMSVSGALFDLVKLEDVSKNVISRMAAEDVFAGALAWAKAYDPTLAELLGGDRSAAIAMFSIDRGGKKPRKDLARWNQVRDTYAYFYDALYRPDFALPEGIAPTDAAALLEDYLAVYDAQDDKDAWFAKIKGICAAQGFCPDVKAYKADPASWKGHVGDVSTVIRLAVTSRLNTPDLWAVMRVTGAERVRGRIEAARRAYAAQK